MKRLITSTLVAIAFVAGAAMHDRAMAADIFVAGSAMIQSYDLDGTFVDNKNLSWFTRGIAVTPNQQNIIVAEAGNQEVTRRTLGLALTGSNPIISFSTADPYGMVYGPDKNLYAVEANAEKIRKYNGSTFAEIGNPFIDTNGDGGNFIVDLTITDQHIYVSSFSGNEILRYNYPSGTFDQVVMDSGDGLGTPWGIDQGLDGNIYVASRNNAKIMKLNPNTLNVTEFASGIVPADGIQDLEWASDNWLYALQAGGEGKPLLRFSADGLTVETVVAGIGGSTKNALALAIIPEPATLGLIAMGGLLMLRRRR